MELMRKLVTNTASIKEVDYLGPEGVQILKGWITKTLSHPYTKATPAKLLSFSLLWTLVRVNKSEKSTFSCLVTLLA